MLLLAQQFLQSTVGSGADGSVHPCDKVEQCKDNAGTLLQNGAALVLHFAVSFDNVEDIFVEQCCLQEVDDRGNELSPNAYFHVDVLNVKPVLLIIEVSVGVDGLLVLLGVARSWLVLAIAHLRDAWSRSCWLGRWWHARRWRSSCSRIQNDLDISTEEVLVESDNVTGDVDKLAELSVKSKTLFGEILILFVFFEILLSSILLLPGYDCESLVSLAFVLDGNQPFDGLKGIRHQPNAIFVVQTLLVHLVEDTFDLLYHVG